MALIIGVTGGIGSGKTLICQAFKSIGIPVFHADFESKNILENNISAQQEILEAFGKEAFTADKPDRKKIASIVFNNPTKLAQLNAILHPKVRTHFADWTKKNAHQPYVIQEAAILFETGLWQQFDKTILVTAPLEERINRVILRDKTNKEAIVQRINNQWTDEKKAELASFIIHNSNTDRLLPQVLNIHQQLLALSTHG
jgi:dephospho-CoA kinase